MSQTLRLRLFGPMQIRLGDAPLPPMRSRKGEWLLALLVLRGGSVSRSWLAGTLWPDSEESRALQYLRRELVAIRQALGPHRDRLETPGHSLQLDVRDMDCDLLAFDAAAARDDEVSLTAAVSLYRGPLLEGCDEAWAIPERQSREVACLAARERLAERAAARGDAAAAILHLRAAVAADPLRESAHRALMRLLADSGDSAAALQLYRDLRLHLRRTLNADVEAETAALLHHIRGRAHRQTPPLARAQTRVLHIPAPLTPLIGRDPERREVRRRLEAGRLLTLVGTGGVGKTRLAIEIAQEMRDEFAGGVCFVELAALDDPALVPRAALDALGLTPQPRRSAVDTLVDRLRLCDLLLILDNCEHLIQPCAEMAGALLHACPYLRILATSREPLGIVGESVWSAPPLPVPPDGPTDTATVCAYPAVALFVERAQQTRPDFALTDDNAGPVARVCRRLDGIPLALELAAARVRTLTPEEIDARLDERFRLLTGGSRTALPRHQTLRSLIDWSYDLLSDPEKALLRRLSVFAGGWTLEEAEAVCAGEPVDRRDLLDGVAALTDRSLAVAETQGSRARYRMLETIRQYARDRLADAGELDVWRERHADHFLALAEQSKPHQTGPEQIRWFDRLDADHDNLRAALRWALESGGAPERALRLCDALWWFWNVRGHYTEGRRWCESALDGAGERRRTIAGAGVLHGAGAMARNQGDFDAAHARFDESLAVRRQLDDRPGVASALHGLGFVASDRGDYGAARVLLDESLALHRAVGNRWGVALVLGRLGLLAHEQGDYGAARTIYEESLSLYRAVGDRWGLGASLSNLGVLAYDRGDYADARALCDEGLAIQREMNNRTGILISQINRAKVACREADLPAARAALTEATQVAWDTADRKRAAEALEAWGDLAALETRWVHAAILLGAADALREAIGAPVPDDERGRHDARIAEVRAALGEEAAFHAAWTTGRGLTREQALTLTAQSPASGR